VRFGGTKRRSGEKKAVTRKKRKEQKPSGEDVVEQAAREEVEQGEAEAALPEEPLVSAEEEAAPKEESEVAVLQEELGLLETQLQNMRDRYIRAVADLDNSRKRAGQAIMEARKEAVAGVLSEVLSVVDDFERALEIARPGAKAPRETRAVYEGVELIYRQLMQMLERRGVRGIEAVGQAFDPTRHEAVAQVPASDEVKEGTVALEMQKGYLVGDRVLRPSKVCVAVRESPEGA